MIASNDNLAIHEDKTKGVYVKDLLEIYVGSSDEVYEVMRRGSNNRVVASTSKQAVTLFVV
jgi:kinesin family protein 5